MDSSGPLKSYGLELATSTPSSILDTCVKGNDNIPGLGFLFSHGLFGAPITNPTALIEPAVPDFHLGLSHPNILGPTAPYFFTGSLQLYRRPPVLSLTFSQVSVARRRIPITTIYPTPPSESRNITGRKRRVVSEVSKDFSSPLKRFASSTCLPDSRLDSHSASIVFLSQASDYTGAKGVDQFGLPPQQ